MFLFVSCGYVLMPNYIRSQSENSSKPDTLSMIMKIRVIAARHLRTNQSKSISKLNIKATIISKQKLGDKQIYSSRIFFLK